jgi:hypothetical protein
MNAANGKPGQAAREAFKAAGQQKITVTGAWRLWGEHPGGGSQFQAIGSEPDLSGHGPPSNPDHVFEIHPVTVLKVGDQETSAVQAIGPTKGFTPHDAQKAFLLGYEKLTCKIIPKQNRTRIVTESLGFNFTDFIIRLGENPVLLKDEQGKEDGHGVICNVYDTEGELLVKNRRMVFLPGTNADEQLQELTKGKRLEVTGIPRISLKLIQYRLDHKNDQFDISPLEWNLPYEMIIVAAKHLPDSEDE